MAGLWDRVTRVDAIIWFGIAALLTAVGYVGGEDALWPFVWLVPHAVILFGSGFFLNIYWWGPTAHGASADLHGNPYRYFRVKALELEPSAPSTFLAG